jgi:flavin reductase (DIM6/NTAB) family NADH-FMN oxidoreductase RutF
MSGVSGFKDVLSRWASGVSVVTTNDDGMLYGITVSSFASVSLDPPLVLVCVANQNRIVSMIGAANGFAVSLLASDQQAASSYFARPGRLPTTDFTEIEGQWTPSGLPVIANALAWVTCTLHASIPQGDHTILVGQVGDTYVAAPDRRPLVYWSRAYRALSD